MKKINGLSKVLCALSVSTALLTGVASAENMQPMNAMPMNSISNQGMMPMNGMSNQGMMPMNDMHNQGMMPMNGMSNQGMMPMNKTSMMMPGMGNGVGNVMPGMQSSQVDYVGAVTTLQHYYPNAMISSISYDAKHNPTYEVEAFTKTQKIEMKIDEATGQVVSNKAKMMNTMKSMKKMRSFNPQNTIIPEGAETKAIERVGSEFQTMEWELKMEGNKVVYELEMTNGANKKADVKVDAMTGKVLSAKVKNTKY